MNKEAMKLALEALEYIDLVDNDRDFLHPHECYMIDQAITALKALAEQPAQRTWVGLTEEEISATSKGHVVRSTYARAIEAKLKEKNT